MNPERERESNLHNSRMLLCSVPRTPSPAPTIFEGITPILSHTWARARDRKRKQVELDWWRNENRQPATSRERKLCMKLFCAGAGENSGYLHQTFCRYCSLYSRNSRYLDILDNLINTFNQLQSEQRPSNYRISGFIFDIYINWIFNTERIIG